MSGSLAKITIFHPRYVTRQLQPFLNTFFLYVCPLHLEAVQPPASREGGLGQSPGFVRSRRCSWSRAASLGTCFQPQSSPAHGPSRLRAPPLRGMSCPRRIKRVDIARVWRFMATPCVYESLPFLLAVSPVTRAVTDPQHGVVATCWP